MCVFFFKLEKCLIIVRDGNKKPHLSARIDTLIKRIISTFSVLDQPVLRFIFLPPHFP